MKRLAWISLALVIGSYICMPMGDPDLWWHIVVGKWIIAHGSVPYVDYWNMYGAGRPWQAYSWSNEVIYALVDSLAGVRGLARLQLLLAVTLVGSFQYLLGRCARSHFFGALLGAYTAIACYAHFSLRPQTVVWILFLGVLVIADSISRKGLSKISCVFLIVVGMIWANTHITAVLGLAALFLWSLQSERGAPAWRRASMAALCFFIGTLLTPYCGGEWITLIQKSGHPLEFSSIDEFKPAHILQFSTGFVLLQLFLVVALSLQDRKILAMWRCLVGGSMMLAGLTAVKFLPFASIALSVMLAAWWRQSNSVKEPEVGGRSLAFAFHGLEQGFNRLHAQTVAALAFFGLCLTFLNVSKLWKSSLDQRLAPKAAVDFIEKVGLSSPILNEFGVGGYLLYRFSAPSGEPLYKVPIDGRTNVNDPAVWRLYTDAFFGREKWREYIMMVQPRTVLWSQQSPFVSLLLEADEWCRVFQSGTTASDYSVFISREEFQSRVGEFESSDCGGQHI